MYTNGLKDRFGSPLVSQRDVNITLEEYALKTDINDIETGLSVVSTIVSDHSLDEKIHITSSEHEELTFLISEKNNFASKNSSNTWT